jgi:AspT/YidE/YbjL antiporter-like protein
MNWLLTAIRQNPELALFVVLAIGYAIGRIRIGSFKVGGVLGSLLAGLAIGQLNVPVPDGMKEAFFLLFVFAISLRSGADFFRSLRSSGVTQVALTVIFLIALRRAGQNLPFTPSTVIERGDVLSISGTQAEIERVAAEVGYGEYPSTATDLLLVGTTITIGGLVGLIPVTVGGVTLSLGLSVGVLLAGLVLGHLRSRDPRFGRVPEAPSRLFESMGLSVFIACVGLQAGTGAIAAARESGVAMLAAATIIVLIPNAATILFGYYILKMHRGSPARRRRWRRRLGADACGAGGASREQRPDAGLWLGVRAGQRDRSHRWGLARAGESWMKARWQLPVRIVVSVMATLSLATAAAAQGRTDVVTIANGDRITGEVVRLERGQLEFKTDDAGTLYLEWDKLLSVVTLRLVEVITTDGRTFLGTLGQSADRTIAVVAAAQTESLPMAQVTEISVIGRSFWRKLDGSIDVGFNYTRSSQVSQLNLNWDVLYRRPGFQARLTTALTQTTQREDQPVSDERGSVEASYLRYRWPRWFVGGAARFETNESLGLTLRSQVSGVVGPRLVNSNRAQLAVGAGLAFNDEQGVDVESTQNLEAIFVFRHSFFTYDRPKTNTDVNVQYYPSLSNPGRNRLQLDASARREFFKDLFLTVSGYYTLDSRPPNPDAEKYDLGLAMSVGWTY